MGQRRRMKNARNYAANQRKNYGGAKRNSIDRQRKAAQMHNRANTGRMMDAQKKRAMMDQRYNKFGKRFNNAVVDRSNRKNMSFKKSHAKTKDIGDMTFDFSEDNVDKSSSMGGEMSSNNATKKRDMDVRGMNKKMFDNQDSGRQMNAAYNKEDDQQAKYGRYQDLRSAAASNADSGDLTYGMMGRGEQKNWNQGNSQGGMYDSNNALNAAENKYSQNNKSYGSGDADEKMYYGNSGASNFGVNADYNRASRTGMYNVDGHDRFGKRSNLKGFENGAMRHTAGGKRFGGYGKMTGTW